MGDSSVKRVADTQQGSVTRRAESAQVPYEDDNTVADTFDESLHGGVAVAITITDAGGLNISWTAGKVRTPAGAYVTTVSGSGVCTNDAVNHLVWVSGTSLTLQATEADPAAEVEVGHIACADADAAGDIWRIHQEVLVTTTVPAIQSALAALFPIVVTSGCLASATNPAVDLEVSVSTGEYWHQGHREHPVTGYDTSTASTLVRCYIDGAGPSWRCTTGHDEVDFTQYNTGNALVATNPAKYYRHLVLITEDNVFFIYAQEEHNTLPLALAGADPTVPAGFIDFPKSLVVITQHGDTLFPTAGSEQLIDVRPLLASAAAFVAGGINNVVEDNTPQLGGNLDSNGNEIQMATTDKLTFHGVLAYIYATAAGALTVFANTLLTLGKDGDVQVGGGGGTRTLTGQGDANLNLGERTTPKRINVIVVKDCVEILAGTGTDYFCAGGVIDVNVTSVGNIGIGLDPLMSYAMPANTLDTDGSSLEIICSGVFADTGSDKTVGFIFGATAVYSQGALVARDSSWEMRCTVVRDGEDTQRISLQFMTDDAVMVNEAVYVTGANNDGAAITIFCHATAGGVDPDDNDIVQHSMKTVFHPAPPT